MILYERHNQIIDHLRKKRISSVKELAKITFSSESSIRRDIKTLEKQGYLKQTYGGVVLVSESGGVVPLTLRDTSNSSVKDELARRAAEYVFDGATILMDGSSTVRRIIKHINKEYSLNIITNNCTALEEAALYLDKAKIFCTGGMFVASSNIFIGSAAEGFIKNTNADILFFSSQAISEDGEISDASEEETSLRKVMLSRAKKKIFLCDSSKVGKRRTFTLCSKNDIDCIVCDKALPWEEKSY